MTATNDSGASGWPDAWKTYAHGLGAGRYTDPEFVRLERDRLERQQFHDGNLKD